ncbi:MULTISPECIES: class I SAM-dependent methyltransferase [Actinoalloteichus]|uniref:Methyltransferase family protein n=1 Tax=Actinoalloteichus fjordicus TaxID=1612552 RepID=A0AAC9PS09_9PSEU|nr:MULTISPECIES: class I SAM-dependent methyltransferase [Actinoalloteichus]APU14512.1 methyltransferase family protein [Actinoalloteichus fjordicus]APU20480.1 methyltransferase family protein [Actinoalloteichus sp. GBA129-24]
MRSVRVVLEDRRIHPVDPLPDLPPETAEEFYGGMAAAWSETGLVLDVGTGSGLVAAELVRRGVPVVTSDVVDRRGPTCPNVPFLLADATALPLRSGSVAGVHIARVLHHVMDWSGAVGEATRVLRPAGVLCLDLGGGRAPDPIEELLDDLRRRAAEVGVLPPAAGNGLNSADQVDEVARRELTRAGDVVVDYAVERTPRAAAQSAVDDPDRWAPGTDLRPLAGLLDDLLADTGLDPDRPLRQARTARYRVYRRPG